MKHKVAIIGKGNIGWAIKELLKDTYKIKQGDNNGTMGKNRRGSFRT